MGRGNRDLRGQSFGDRDNDVSIESGNILKEKKEIIIKYQKTGMNIPLQLHLYTRNALQSPQ